MAVVDVNFRGAGVSMMDPNRAAQLERIRLETIARAWAYYDGQMPEQMKTRAGDTNDNVLLNFSKLIINKSVSSLFGDDVAFQTENDGVQDLVDFAWGSKEQKMITLQRIGVNGGIAGHAFVRLQLLENATTRVVVLDPSNVDVEWAPDDFEKVLAYNVEWTGYDEQLQKEVSFRQVIRLEDPDVHGPWSITDYRSVGEGSWVLVNEADWPYPFAPIVDCQNLPTANEFYGDPDLDTSNLNLIDRINAAASNIQKILRYHAHPKVFVYGYSGKDIDLSSDRAVNFPSTDTRVDILGMPTDLAAAFQMYDRLIAELLRLTDTPKAALGDIEAASMASSGLALKLGFMPLVDRTSIKRMTYGHLLNEVNNRVQALADQDPTEVEINWPPITPDDAMGDAQTALLKQQLGVSKRTLLEEMGYDPDIEGDQSREEAEEAIQQQAKAMEATAGAQAEGAAQAQDKVKNEDATKAKQQPEQMKRRSRDLGAK